MKVNIYVKNSEVSTEMVNINTDMCFEQFQNLLDAVNCKKFVTIQTEFLVVCINTDTILRITATKEWEK